MNAPVETLRVTRVQVSEIHSAFKQALLLALLKVLSHFLRPSSNDPETEVAQPSFRTSQFYQFK